MNQKEWIRIAMTAAIYTAVSLSLAPITYGAIQIRIAESLTLLPLIYKKGIYGVTLGCFLTNLIGAMMGINLLGYLDAIIGTLATFLAAELTWRLRSQKIWGLPLWSILMPVVMNGVIIGLELGFVLFPQNVAVSSLICGLEVAAGELVSVIAGWFLIKGLKKTKLFDESEESSAASSLPKAKD